MTDYKDIFEKALSEACEKADFSDNDQLYGIVKERTSIMENRRARIRKPLVIAASIAAAAALTVTVGAVSFGFLSDFFTKYFGDSATKQLADEGYIYTAENYAEDNASDGTAKQYPAMGETFEKGIFSAKVLGIAGDTQDPMMLLDINVKDADIAAESDMIGVYTLALSPGEFDSGSRGKYMAEYSKGVRDEEDPSLYHVSVRVPPLWVTQGNEVVFDIVSIHTLGGKGFYEELGEYDLTALGLPEDAEPTGIGFFERELNDFEKYAEDAEHRIKVHDVDMQFRFVIPENVLKEAPMSWYDMSEELVYKADGKEFTLCCSDLGAHSTFICLACGVSENAEIPGEEDVRKYAGQFVLSVDGREYRPDMDMANIFCDTEGSCYIVIKNMCYLNLTFPAVDYDNAQSITLSANGVSYDIRH